MTDIQPGILLISVLDLVKFLRVVLTMTRSELSIHGQIDRLIGIVDKWNDRSSILIQIDRTKLQK